MSRTLLATSMVAALACASTPSQPSAARRGELYRADLEALAAVLTSTHPAVEDGKLPAPVQRELVAARARVSSVASDREFTLLAQRVVARFGDGHTAVEPKDLLGQDRFPLKFRWLGERLFVTDHGASVSPEVVGRQVVTVQGRPLAEVVATLAPLISCENEICERIRITHLLASPSVMRELGLVDGAGRLDVTLAARSGAALQLAVAAAEQSAIKWAAPLPRHPVTAEREAPFSYSVDAGRRLCYLQFNQMTDLVTLRHYGEAFRKAMGEARFREAEARLQAFGPFLEAMFAEMHAKGIETLVVDLRNNGGGNSLLGDQLVRHLAVAPPRRFAMTVRLSKLLEELHPDTFANGRRELEAKGGPLSLPQDWTPADDGDHQMIVDPESPFFVPEPAWRFAGELVLLVGNRTFSSASMLAVLLGDAGLATIVGEPLSQKPSA